ncbi:MAG: peptidylprolyl isomerase, partial [Planctomycetaceae bacterium]
FLGLSMAGVAEPSEKVSKPGKTQKGTTSSRSAPSKSPKRSSPTIATVNGDAITEDDLRFMLLSRRVKQPTPELREELLERLIDRFLVRQFLKSRKVEADPRQLEEAVAQLKRQLRESGRDPDVILGELGYDDSRIRDDLGLTLAWQGHINRIVTPKEIEEYFADHRIELDGTEVRASQILIQLPADAGDGDLARAKTLLDELRGKIESGALRFADAAKEHSQAPSRDIGGDIGWFPYRGRMPSEFSSVAFGLKKGTVSTPFRTRFGVHLLMVTDLKPGMLSLEDARSDILRALSDRHWDQVVNSERSKARIERPQKP